MLQERVHDHAGRGISNASGVEREIVEIGHTTSTMYDETGVDGLTSDMRANHDAVAVFGGVYRVHLDVKPHVDSKVLRSRN